MQSLRGGVRDHAGLGVRPDLRQVASLWQHGSRRPGLAARPARARARRRTPAWRSIRGYVEDSGEGRWTVFNAIDDRVPAPAITLALFARFASRQDESFAAKVNAALRNQFGGHAVKAVERSGDGRGTRFSRACASAHARPVRPRRSSAPPATSPQRKLIPALYSLAVRGCSRGGSPSSASRARRRPTRSFGADARRPSRTSRGPARRGGVAAFAAGMRYVGEDFRPTRATDAGRRRSRGARRASRGTAGNRVFYLAVPPSAIALLVERLGAPARRRRRLDAPHRREAVRPRPGLGARS